MEVVTEVSSHEKVPSSSLFWFLLRTEAGGCSLILSVHVCFGGSIFRKLADGIGRVIFESYSVECMFLSSTVDLQYIFEPKCFGCLLISCQPSMSGSVMH